MQQWTTCFVSTFGIAWLSFKHHEMGIHNFAIRHLIRYWNGHPVIHAMYLMSLWSRHQNIITPTSHSFLVLWILLVVINLFKTTSWHGNSFHITGSLWRESTIRFTLQRTKNAELWCFIWCKPGHTVEQTLEMFVISYAMTLIWRFCAICGKRNVSPIICLIASMQTCSTLYSLHKLLAWVYCEMLIYFFYGTCKLLCFWVLSHDSESEYAWKCEQNDLLSVRLLKLLKLLSHLEAQTPFMYLLWNAYYVEWCQVRWCWTEWSSGT